MAYIVTLSGTHNDMMDGWWTDAKKFVGRQVSPSQGVISYLWRPSRMEWMAPVGGAVTAVGGALVASGIAAPVGAPLIAVGGAMTIGGTVGTAVHAADQEKKAKTAAEKQAVVRSAQAKNTRNIAIVGAVGLAALTLYLSSK